MRTSAMCVAVLCCWAAVLSMEPPANAIYPGEGVQVVTDSGKVVRINCGQKLTPELGMARLGRPEVREGKDGDKPVVILVYSALELNVVCENLAKRSDPDPEAPPPAPVLAVRKLLVFNPSFVVYGTGEHVGKPLSKKRLKSQSAVYGKTKEEPRLMRVGYPREGIEYTVDRQTKYITGIEIMAPQYESVKKK